MSSEKNHDSIFKQGLHHFLKEFFEEFFPELLQKLEINYDLPISEDANDVDTKDGDKKYVDIIYSAKVFRTGEKVMVHIEPQSYYEKEFPLRMYNYNHTLRKKHNAKVITIVVGFLRYPQNAPSEFTEKSLVDEKIEHYFRFQQIHLKKLFWRDYVDNNLNPIVTCFLGLMKDANKNKDEIRLISYINLLKMELSKEKKTAVLNFIMKYLPLDTDEQRDQFLLTLEKEAKEKGLKKELEALETPFFDRGVQVGEVKQARKRVLRDISRVKGSPPALEIRQIIESITKLDDLETMSDEIWGIRDINEIEKIVKKYKKH